MDGTRGSSSPLSPGTKMMACLLWQDEMDRRGQCTGRGRVWRFKRDRREVRALPHHPVVRPPDSAWQPPQPLHYPAQCVLVDQM